MPPCGRTGGEAVGLGECRQQFELDAVLDRGRHRLDGGGVVEVTSGGGIGQQEVIAHQADEDGDVWGLEPHSPTDVADDPHPDFGVVARESLADVMEECPDQQEVGALHRGRQGAARAAASRR